MKPLTKTQKETLDFIKEFTLKKGYSPSYREIQKKFRLKSVDSVWERINHLTKKGYVIRKKHSIRELQIKEIENIFNFVKNFNPKLFNHPKRYKSLIEILVEFKKSL